VCRLHVEPATGEEAAVRTDDEYPAGAEVVDLGTEIGDRYRITGMVGTFGGDSPCDAPNGSTYADGRCRCIVCSRCGRHTGNSTQGHLWGFCKVTKASRGFHLCCPGNCELEANR
jgi:hypothetical protein